MVTRLALLGAGRIGKVHAGAIASDRRARLVAVADANEAAAHAIADAASADVRTIEEIENEIEAQLDAEPQDGDRRQPVLTRRMVSITNQEPESAAKLVRGWLAEGERG